MASVLALLLSAAMFSLFFSHLPSNQRTAKSQLPDRQEIDQDADVSLQSTDGQTATTSHDSSFSSFTSSPSLPPTELHHASPNNSTLSSEQLVQSPESGSHFDFDLVYAYVHSYVSGDVHGLSDYLVFNITFVCDMDTNSSNTIIDTYLVEICSGEKAIGRGAFGFASNDLSIRELLGITIGLPATHSGARPSSSGSWTANLSYLRTNSIPIFSPTDIGIISVRIQRIDWLSTASTSNNPHSLTLVKQVQLEKFGKGFLYNILVPEDQLSQIDPFSPPYPVGSATDLGYAFVGELRD